MGLFSKIFNTLRSLPNKIKTAALSRSIRRSSSTSSNVSDSGKDQIIANLQSVISNQQAMLEGKDRTIQDLNQKLIAATAASERNSNNLVGAVKLSSDNVKAQRQLDISNKIDKARADIGATPGSEEWKEIRAKVLNDEGLGFGDHSDPPAYEPTLTEEQQQAYNNLMQNSPYSPFFS